MKKHILNLLISLLLFFGTGKLFAQSPVVVGYFPSWSETWASAGTNSKMREIPSFVTHVFLSFGKPDMTYVQGSYDIAQTGIQTPYDGCTLKETVKVLKDRGVKVILSIGGETYWNTPSAYNINYQQIKDLVDDMGFAGIDWDYEPDGSFSGIGTPTNVQHFIDFVNNSRALMPASEGYIIACAPSGVGALGGVTNDDPSSPYRFANRNTLTGESDANLYNGTVPTNGINMFGFSATGHMIPVFAAVGDKLDLVAYQGYNLGASTNRTLMYDAYAYYAEIHGFKVAAGVHYPNEPWGPYYTYTHTNVASLADHIKNYPSRVGDGDGVMIWQLLLTGSGSSAYSYMHVGSDVLNGATQANAITNANNFTTQTYTGGSEVSCFCEAPTPSLGADQSICGVSSITLNSNVAVQSGVTFTWKLNGVAVVTNSSTQNTYTITQAGTYKVEVSKAGCSNDDVIIITNNIAAPNLGSDINICPSGSTLLNTGLSNINYTYVWSKDAVVIPTALSSSYTATVAGTYAVTVSATGCTSATDNIIVTSTIPAFDLGSGTNLCSPATAVLSTGLSNPAFGYVWSKDGLVLSGATSSSYTVTAPGVYNVTVSATGCTTSTDNVTITSSLPTAANDTICVAGQVTLTASESVQWYTASTGGTLLNTGITYTPTISANTNYWISAGSSVQNYTTMRSSFQGDGWQQYPYVYGTKLVVYQNLSLKEVTVNAQGGSVKINVVGSNGTSIVATQTFPSATGLTPLTLTNFNLTPGTYYLNAVGSSSNLLVDLTPASNYLNSGILLVEGTAYWDWGTPSGGNYTQSSDYGNFVNLKYSVGSSCDRVMVSGIIDPTHPDCGQSCTAAVSIAANSNTICAGSQVSFTATPTNGGTSPSYQWQVNGVNAGTNSSTFTSTSLSNNQIVTCILTSNANCASGSPTVTSNAVTMTVNSIPSTPVVTVTNNCGNSVLATSGSNLSWSTGATGVSISVTSGGTYTVTQTVNGCSSPVGSAVAAPVSIPSAPVVSVVNNCGNSVLTTSGNNLSWSTGATTSSITVTTGGTYTVTQTVNGCTSTSGTAVASPAVTPSTPLVTVVNNCGNSVLSTTGTNLVWSTGATTSSITVTTGGTYTVTQATGSCLSSPGSGVAVPISLPSAPVITVVNNCGSAVLTTTGNNLIWSTGTTTLSITVTTGGTYTVTQTVNGCTSLAGSAVAAPISIPVAPVVTVVNNCESSVLSASGSNLLWSTGVSTASITVTTGGVYTVTQTVNGCISNTSSAIAQPNVTPAAPLVTAINQCGQSVLTATGSGIVWSDGSITSSITVTSSGTYTVTQTVGNCTSQPATISSSPLVIPTVTLSSFEEVCIDDPAFELTTGIPSGGVYSGTGITGNQFDPSSAGYGTFMITYTYTDPSTGCSDSDQQAITVGCIGIEELSSELISIYPNPTKDIFTIQLINNVDVIKVVIYDLSGRLIQINENYNGGELLKVDLSHYLNGVYQLEIITNKGIFNERIVLQK